MVKAAKALDTFGNELFYEVNFCNYLRVSKSTHDVNDDSLEVIWIDEEFLSWYIVPFPEAIKFFADLARAAVVNPL